MTEKYNVIWILVDAIRNYHSVGDELGRLPVMDKLAKKGIFFTQAITPATSTSMSISSQMVGIPACYLSRNFVDFKYEPENFVTLSRILKDNGYKNYAMSFAVDLRYKFHGIIDHVPKMLWPKGYPMTVAWDNDGVVKLFDTVMSQALREPFFFFVHINGRRDYNVNDKVEYMFDALDRYLKDSIIILNSDHGMPDRRRKEFYDVTTKEGLLLNRHDLVMTDDNVLIPLIISYPKCKRMKISTAVGAIDIVPTILELLNINANPEWGIIGKSLVPLIEGRTMDVYEKRKIRTDTRYLTQKDRITSIRDSRYKYVFYRDIPFMEKEHFFHISMDNFESNNLISSNDNKYQKLIREFREEYKSQAAEEEAFHEKYLSRKFKRETTKIIRKPANIKEIVLFGRGDYSFNCILYRIMQKSFVNANILYFIDLKKSDPAFLNEHCHPFTYYEEVGRKFMETICSLNRQVDLFFILQTNKNYMEYKSILKIRNVISPRRHFILDYNLDISKNLLLRNVRSLVKRAVEKKDEYLIHPREIIHDLKKVVRGNVGINVKLHKYRNQGETESLKIFTTKNE